MFKIVSRLLAIVIIGLFSCVWIAQNNSALKQRLCGSLIEFLEENWKTKISIKQTKVSFFTFSVLLKEGTIAPTDNRKFKWHFDRCKIQVSLWDFLFKGRYSLTLFFDNVRAHAVYENGKLDLAAHIQDVFTIKRPDIPIDINELQFYNLCCNCTYNNKDFLFRLPGTLHISQKVISPTLKDWQIVLSVEKGMVDCNKATYAHNINGTVRYSTKEAAQSGNGLTYSLQGQSNFLENDKDYFVKGVFGKDKKVEFKDSKHLTCLSFSLPTYEKILIQGFTSSHLLEQIKNLTSTEQINTQTSPSLPNMLCQCDMAILINQNVIKPAGNVVLTFQSHIPLLTKDIAIFFPIPEDGDLDPLRQRFTQAIGNKTCIAASASWNMATKSGSCLISNANAIAAANSGAQKDKASSMSSSFMIKPHELQVMLKFAQGQMEKGTYQCTVTNKTTLDAYNHHGTFAVKDTQLCVNGLSARGKYLLEGVLSSQPYITKFLYEANGRKMIDLASNTSKPRSTLQGTAHWAFLRSFLDPSWQRFIFNNKCLFSVALNQDFFSGSLSGNIQLAQGHFFVPGYFNLIEKVEGNFQFLTEERKIILSDILIGLRKGTLASKRAVCTLSEDYRMQTVHMPLTINNLFVNWRRDFYGFVCGSLLINKKIDSQLKAYGTTVLKKSLLKDSFFSYITDMVNNSSSQASAQAMLPFDVEVKVLTQHPIRVKTSTLELFASLDLTVKNTLQKGKLTSLALGGSISLGNGYLKILSHKLRVEHGRIRFMSQMQDPTIDLTAKNKIGRYMVSLNVSGSLKKPNITFESDPDLGKEQIIGLLLKGSDNFSLQQDLPAILLQNIDSLIFPNKKTSSKAALVDTLTKTFKYVQIAPTLSNNPSDAKVKGMISVDLNKQLHAKIEKDISMQKDFKDFGAQLEYQLSDDISIKVRRDQRGEIGSELEMRLKLG